MPRTLRELVWMRDARQRAEWAHTSSVMALLAELKRNRKRRFEPFSPAEFDPTVSRHEEPVVEVSLNQFAGMIGAKVTSIEPEKTEAPECHE